ncbi:hypothetical protein D3C71_1987160 [compost metagenome]
MQAAIIRASPKLNSSCRRLAKSPCAAVISTPSSVTVKPITCAIEARVRNSMKLNRKISIGMPAWRMTALIALVYFSAE